MRLSNCSIDLRGITLDEAGQLPVFLDATEKREREISPERKLRNVLLRFVASRQPLAGIFTIASMSFAIIGGNSESFLLFDSHSHPSRGAGAVVLTGCEEIGAYVCR